MKLLSIGEVATRAGVRPSALRYYEDAGILPPVPRSNGRRRYDTDMVRMIELLRFAQRAGFTLTEVKTLFGASGRGAGLSARWRSLAGLKLKELDELVASATRMRRFIKLGLQCACVRFEDCKLPTAAKRAKSHGTR